MDFNDVPEDIEYLSRLIDVLGGEPPTEQDVWEAVKEYAGMPTPDFSNLYIRLVYERLGDIINEKFDLLELEVDYDVNNRASRFYVNGQAIGDADELMEVIKDVFEDRKELLSDKEKEVLNEEYEYVFHDKLFEERGRSHHPYDIDF